MDKQETISLLDELLLKGDFTDQYGDICDSSPYEEAVDVAVKAIEKQTKKSVIKKKCNFTTICYCPNCNNNIWLDNMRCLDYCNHCGQALDWDGDNNDK